ncbi:MAG: DUF5020 family protein [Bacteroidales bacterium]|nr:DUF5020 family protein [Bacteroidales bacterium]MDD4669723.1 DUF5020 family protein [Bacteroidales bacterium]
MKHKLLLSIILLCTSLTMSAQLNIHTHYNYGIFMYDETRQSATITSSIEYVGFDKWGSTYFIADFNYMCEGISSMYWEIERQLQFWKGPLSVRVEYCGGSYPIYHHTFQAGPTYSFTSDDKLRGFSATLMYMYHVKQAQKSSPKFSGAWFVDMFDSKLTFNGFTDLWEFEGIRFVAEPQLWLNLNSFSCINKDFNLSIGGELRLTYNLTIADKFCVIPTAALKWTFR